MKAGRYLPWVVVFVTALSLLSVAWPATDQPGEKCLHEFGRLPVVHDGRIKPWDTLARTCLMKLSGRQSFADAEGHSQPAIRWLLAVLADSPDVQKYQVFRIENDGVLGLLDLQPRSGFRYALEEFTAKIDKVVKEAKRIQNVDEKRREAYEVKLLELVGKLELYSELAQMRLPHALPPQAAGEEWATCAEVNEEAKTLALSRLKQEMHQGKIDVDKMNREQFLTRFRKEMHRAQDELNPAADAFASLLLAYTAADPQLFNQRLSDFQQYLAHVPDRDMQRARFEVLFNDCAPFYLCCILYGVIFVLACFSFVLAGVSVRLSQPLNWTAFGLMALLLVVHSGALLARMYIMDRPLVFVTNLYSSAIFIGWGCVGLGLIIEAIYQLGIGNLIGSVLGFLTVLIAHQLHLWSSNDTLEMMQAVLDTNFWLATHVTCVTLGYTATFMAGFLGMLFIFLGVATPLLDRDLFKTLGQMIYGVVCFATLLSFVGTVLGGIWADQSWGRFWGWDPKENGALLIVIWNALILHARWCGMIRQRGMAVLAVVGNMVTGWSWFGTNQLGVGLHAYGFNNQLALGLTIFWSTQLVFILLGLLPTSLWWSIKNRSTVEPHARVKARDLSAVT